MDLYKITFQGKVSTYSSSEYTITFMGNEYIPSAITRTEISIELTNAEVRLDLPQDTYPFKYFVLNSPSSEVEITIYDFSSGFEIFSGIVTQVVFDRNKKQVTATLKRKEAVFDSIVPYRTYGTSCSFILYEGQCGISKQAHTISTNVFTVSQNRDSITSTTLSTVANGTFMGGSINTDLGETAYITSHIGNTVTLDTILLDIPTTISFSKGCDKSLSQCESKFNNLANFGGFPFIPTKNPATESI
jgi:uncharacterized phage protein (TIGR02218 family)